MSKKIPADPNFSFWTYEDMYLTNKAEGEVLTLTDGRLQILPKETASKEPSQQWSFDINSKTRLAFNNVKPKDRYFVLD